MVDEAHLIHIPILLVYIFFRPALRNQSLGFIQNLVFSIQFHRVRVPIKCLPELPSPRLLSLEGLHLVLEVPEAHEGEWSEEEDEEDGKVEADRTEEVGMEGEARFGPVVEVG